MSESTLLSETQREARRQEMLGEIPSWYSPTLHMITPTFLGILIMLGCISYIHNLQMWELITIPITYFIANGVEWVAHHDLLHKRRPLGAAVLYEQHVPRHHVLYITDDMAYRDRREFKLILMPSYFILVFAVITLPISLLLTYLLNPNVAAVFMITSLTYGLGYEWLHLIYHLRKDHPIGRLKLVRFLQKHHAIHHDPRLMLEWNMNITIPIWDWILGRSVRDLEDGLRRENLRRRKSASLTPKFENG